MAAPAWANPNPSSGAGAGGAPSPLSVDEHESMLFRPYSTLDEPVRETIMRDVNAVVSKLKIVLQPLKRHAPYVSSLYNRAYGRVSTSDSGGGAPTAADEGDGSGGAASSSSTQSSPPDPAAAASPASATSPTQQQQHPHNDPQALSEVDRQLVASLKDWDLWGPLVLCLTLAVVLSFRAPTKQSSLVFATVFSLVWVGSTVVTLNAQLLGGSISFFQSLCALGYSLFPLTLSAGFIGVLRLLIHPWLWIDVLIAAVGGLWAIRTGSLFVGLYLPSQRRTLALYPIALFYVAIAWMIVLF